MFNLSTMVPDWFRGSKFYAEMEAEELANVADVRQQAIQDLVECEAAGEEVKTLAKAETKALGDFRKAQAALAEAEQRYQTAYNERCSAVFRIDRRRDQCREKLRETCDRWVFEAQRKLEELLDETRQMRPEELIVVTDRYDHNLVRVKESFSTYDDIDRRVHWMCRTTRPALRELAFLPTEDAATEIERLFDAIPRVRSLSELAGS